MKPRAYFLILAAGLSACAGAPVAVKNYDEIGGETAVRLAQSGAVLLDVGSPDEYLVGHAAGALSIPLSQMWTRMDELPASNDAEIVVYDRDYLRQARAAVKLQEEGFSRVHLLRSGYAAWIEAGGPVKTGPPPAPVVGRGGDD